MRLINRTEDEHTANTRFFYKALNYILLNNFRGAGNAGDAGVAGPGPGTVRAGDGVVSSADIQDKGALMPYPLFALSSRRDYA